MDYTTEKIEPVFNYPRNCFLKKNLKILNLSFKKNIKNNDIENIESFKVLFESLKNIAEKLPFTDCITTIHKLENYMECSMTFHNGFFVNIAACPENNNIKYDISQDNIKIFVGIDSANDCFNNIDRIIHFE